MPHCWDRQKQRKKKKLDEQSPNAEMDKKQRKKETWMSKVPSLRLTKNKERQKNLDEQSPIAEIDKKQRNAKTWMSKVPLLRSTKNKERQKTWMSRVPLLRSTKNKERKKPGWAESHCWGRQKTKKEKNLDEQSPIAERDRSRSSKEPGTKSPLNLTEWIIVMLRRSYNLHNNEF